MRARRGENDEGGGGGLTQWSEQSMGREWSTAANAGGSRRAQPQSGESGSGGRALLLAGLMDGKGRGRKGGKRKRSANTPQVAELLATITKHIGNAYAEGSKKVVKSALTAFRDFEDAYPERQTLLEPTYAGDPVAALQDICSMSVSVVASMRKYSIVGTEGGGGSHGGVGLLPLRAHPEQLVA